MNVTVNNPLPIDISGWTITQANASYVYTFPAGTLIQPNGYLVIGRDATKTAFQSFWGVTLGSNVVYINSAAAFPVINGSENYILKNASGTTIDGITPSQARSLLWRSSTGGPDRRIRWSRSASPSRCCRRSSRSSVMIL